MIPFSYYFSVVWCLNYDLCQPLFTLGPFTSSVSLLAPPAILQKSLLPDVVVGDVGSEVKQLVGFLL